MPRLDTFCQALEQGISISAAAVPLFSGGWAGNPLLVHGGHELDPCSPTSFKPPRGWTQGDLGFLLSLLGGIFNAGLDMLQDSARTWGRNAQPFQGQILVPLTGMKLYCAPCPICALWTVLNVGCRQLNPGSAFCCLLPVSPHLGSPGATRAPGALSCLVTSVLGFRPKQTWPLKLFLIRWCPLLCPLWLQDRIRSAGGRIQQLITVCQAINKRGR